MFNNSAETKTFINTMVRGIYDLQKLRIQFGNRVVANFKRKFHVSGVFKAVIISPKDYSAVEDFALTPEELEKMIKKIMNIIKADYARVADAVSEGEKNKIIPLNKFKPDGLISDYNEYILVRQYMTLLASEEEAFTQLGRVLDNIPIYQEFLKEVVGLGPAMAGVIISEIDIHKSKTSSALWRYAGLDTVLVGEYVDSNGKVQIIDHLDFMSMYGMEEEENQLFFKGHLVTRRHMARGMKTHTMQLTTYVDKDGEEQIKKTIGFNPFLKTKLLGVLAGSFLKAGTAYLDGKRAGAAKRLEVAVSEGFNIKDFETGELATEVIKFLRSKGHEVIVEPSHYGKVYYNYRERLNQMPEHESKSVKHRHNMALRYALKRFMVDLYVKWRTLEGLEVVEEYSVRKLGLIHHDEDYSQVD